MSKWSDMWARIIPWLDTDDAEERRRLHAETADLEREQQALAPLISDQTEYLIRRGSINGFSGQLRLGFERRATGE